MWSIASAATERAGSAAQFPILPIEIGAKRPVPLLAQQGEPGLLVDMAGRAQAILGPQDDAVIASLAGEAHGLLDQQPAHALAAKGRLDIEHAQLRRACGLARAGRDNVDGSGDLAATISNPQRFG